MNAEEAKQLLENHRPGWPASEDPALAEALALSDKDPELRKWLAARETFDAQMQEQMGTIPVPVDLREKLLALRSPERPRRLAMLCPALAMAAAIVVLGILATVWWQSQPVGFSALRQHVMEKSWGQAPHLAFKSDDLNQVRAWLASVDVKDDLKIPSALEGARLHGCTLVKWRGHTVPILCLSDGHRHMHLYVMERSEIIDEPPTDQPEFDKFGPMSIASWSKADKTYMLTGYNTLSFFKKFRKSGKWVTAG